MPDTEEPDWAVLLEALYKNQQKQIQTPEDSDDTTVVSREQLSDELSLSPSAIKDAEEYMQTIGLLERTELGTRIDRRLTSQGFKVAHDRVMASQQIDTNRAVAILTLGLVAVAVVDSMVRFSVGIGAFGLAGMSTLAGVGLLVMVVIILHKLSLLPPVPRR